MPMTFVSLVYLLLVYNSYCQFVMKICASHFITFNVRKSVCMFFKSKMNKLCDNVPVVLSGNTIDFVHETKYLGVIINSNMKTPSDVVRQTRKFHAQTNMLPRNFRYCTNYVKCTLFRSFCANMYCCLLWFNSTSSTIKKLKTSYNSALRNILLIKKPYSASTMFCSSSYSFFLRITSH